MKRALIVEDNPTWSDVLSRYCQQEEIEPVVATSPQLAMDQLDGHKPDVIILDMLLAAETGMALLNELRSYGDLADIPVIVCTSIDGLGSEQLGSYGVSSVLNKSTVTPVDVKYDLRRVVYEQ